MPKESKLNSFRIFAAMNDTSERVEFLELFLMKIYRNNLHILSVNTTKMTILFHLLVCVFSKPFCRYLAQLFNNAVYVYTVINTYTFKV